MKTITKITLAMMFLLASVSIAAAQTYVLSGSQTQGTLGKNAQLECTPVHLNQAVKIVSISGDNNGFWISDGSNTVASYWQPNDPSAIGKQLPAGTYYVYPNLKNRQNHATVSLKLE